MNSVSDSVTEGEGGRRGPLFSRPAVAANTKGKVRERKGGQGGLDGTVVREPGKAWLGSNGADGWICVSQGCMCNRSSGYHCLLGRLPDRMVQVLRGQSGSAAIAVPQQSVVHRVRAERAREHDHNLVGSPHFV